MICSKLAAQNATYRFLKFAARSAWQENHRHYIGLRRHSFGSEQRSCVIFN